MNIFVFTRSTLSLNQTRPEAELYCSLARRGHKVTVMTKAIPEQVEKYKEAGVKVIEGAARKKICFESIKVIRKELTDNSYDIVYACCSKTIPNAAFACIGFNVKLAVYRGTTGGLYRHDPTAYLTILHPRVDGVVCVSNAVKEDIAKRIWKNKDNLTTIYKGHNIDWYNSVQPANLKEFGISNDKFTIICAVNARPSKGISVMLEASNLIANLPDVHLILAGKSMDQEPYTSLINNSKMKERIHVVGFRLDVPQLTKASQLLVQPSISGEGLPRAVMEAMGLGTPVVITTTGGGKEVVTDGMSGFVVPIKSPEAIAEKITVLYHNKELAKEMSALSQEKIRNELSLERTADNYLQYFNHLLK